jgi:hypothetical protein
LKIYEPGDWVSHKKLKILGKIIKVDNEGRVYEVWVADKLKNQIWNFQIAKFYQKKKVKN